MKLISTYNELQVYGEMIHKHGGHLYLTVLEITMLV
jgi:hypothetical protein